jgi:hypothetical protein
LKTWLLNDKIPSMAKVANPALMQLEGLVGIWTVDMIFPADPSNIVRGNARWEKSSDGSKWEHDFDVAFTRVK